MREMDVTRLGGMLRDAGKTVVFTGAGMSTETGIPDFRGPSGLWKTNMPIDFQEFIASRDKRREAWRRKFAMEEVFRSARPGPGHQALAGLVASGRVSLIITQNIDNMHQNAGVSSDRVVELHGNGSYAHCLSCGLRHELDEVRSVFEETGDPPDCRACGGLVKTATISFGQAMPEDEMTRAEMAAESCDLMLALGSSLTVWPAAGLPILAKQTGARLAILNAEPTELDELADVLIRDNLSDVLPKVAAACE